jgi:hypothetical protein
MSIQTLDAALAGMRPPVDFVKVATGTMVAGRPMSLLYLAGAPGAGVVPTVGIGGAALTSYPGQLPFSNPGAGNSYLARLEAMATIAGTLVLADRLWHNNGIDATSAAEQTFTAAPQIPARDSNGANAGAGVYAAVESQVATTTNTPTLTLKYTNSAGEADLTSTNITPTVAASPVGTLYLMGLAAGNVGIRTPQSLQLSSTWGAGSLGVVLYRVLAKLELIALVPNALDALTSGFPRMYDNTVPFLFFIPNTTTTSYINGHVIYTQG